MQIRDNYLTSPGGDSIQFLKTKEYLTKMGISVDVSIELEPDLSGYDIVHLFNLTRIQETYIQAKNAIKQNKPYCLSTIYWPFDEMNKKGINGLRKILYSCFTGNQIERLKALYKFVFKRQRNKGCRKLIFGSYSKMQKFVVENSSICLPNSSIEMVKIYETLKTKEKKYVVVPNGLDLNNVIEASLADVNEYEKYRGFIVCVARISQRKNQLLLVEAFKKTAFKLLFVGKSSPGEMKYYKKFIKEIEGCSNIEYIESIPNKDIYKLYKVCKVSVLPSWFETPGLVSLEAAAMGCNIAITDKGTTRDYFGDYAFYFDLNKEDVYEKVVMAYNAPFNEELRAKILSSYTWEQAAIKTIDGYNEALKNA